jgi:hypothetical protein
MSKVNEKIKNHPFKVITNEDELANMIKNRDLFIQKLGKETYDNLVKKLENDILDRKRPRSASPQEV